MGTQTPSALKAPLRVIALTKESPEYGGHSSYYTQAFHFAPDDGVKVKIVTPRAGLLSRLSGKIFSAWIGAEARNQAESAAELRFLTHTQFDSGALGHIANIEDHLPLLRSLKATHPRWLATVHFPATHWVETDAAKLRHFQKVITLCRRDAKFFARWMPEDRIAFIPHGVDTVFFRPDDVARSQSPRLVFVGKWLRDFDMAGSVFLAALEEWPNLAIDVVVPLRWAQGTKLAALRENPRIHWHENVDDKTLRAIYQRAWLLVLPLHETGANNTLVEALACGLVPVTNHIGGIPDYGGGNFFPTCSENSVAAYLNHIGNLIRSPENRAAASAACRQFAETQLDWKLVRAQHLALYKTLLPSR